MITIVNIYKAIRSRLEAKIADIPVQTKDLKNPKPPCFYIKFITKKTDKAAKRYENNVISFDVIYFSDKDEVLGLLNVEKRLCTVFKQPLDVLVKNDYVQSDAADINKVEIKSISTSLNEDDYTLNCTLDIEVMQLVVDESDYVDSEMLDEMVLKLTPEVNGVMSEMVLTIEDN